MTAEARWMLAGAMAQACLNRTAELMDTATQEQLIAAIRVLIADLLTGGGEPPKGEK